MHFLAETLLMNRTANTQVQSSLLKFEKENEIGLGKKTGMLLPLHIRGWLVQIQICSELINDKLIL